MANRLFTCDHINNSKHTKITNTSNIHVYASIDVYARIDVYGRTDVYASIDVYQVSQNRYMYMTKKDAYASINVYARIDIYASIDVHNNTANIKQQQQCWFTFHSKYPYLPKIGINMKLTLLIVALKFHYI